MKAQSMSSVSPPTPLHLSLSVRVLMVYEDLDTGNRVMRVLDSLHRRCGKEVVFQTEMWKSDILGCPSMGRMAAEAAVETDVLIVSAHGGAPLSDEVKVWFKKWIGQRGRHPAALVALLNNSNGSFGTPDSTRSFLQQTATEGRMEFVAILTEEQETDLSGRREAGRDEQPPPVLEQVLRKNAHEDRHHFASEPEEGHLVHSHPAQEEILV